MGSARIPDREQDHPDRDGDHKKTIEPVEPFQQPESVNVQTVCLTHRRGSLLHFRVKERCETVKSWVLQRGVTSTSQLEHFMFSLFLEFSLSRVFKLLFFCFVI